MAKSQCRILTELKKLADPERAACSHRFLQAHLGGYGEGDQFLGVTVPKMRLVAKACKDLDPQSIVTAIQSPWHESRLTALFVLVHRYSKAKPEQKAEWLKLFLDQLDYVNNWDLVDSSAPKILGEHLLKHPGERKILKQLASSGNLWRERVSVVATMPLIRNNEFSEILELCKRFLNHPHDLMHKATGWMLRDVGDRDVEVLHQFLDRNTPSMPRTMLRYCLEHQTPAIKQHYMSMPRKGK